jgi:hypothetical protein
MARFSIRYFLRAVGLHVLNALYYGRNYECAAEQKKHVITNSSWVAFQRSLVHLLPSTASVVIIALNLNGFFIGFELAGIPNHDQIDMAALQVAAKLQELLIIASIGSIVYHRLRHDLLTQGLPFGLLSSGVSFTQVSYIWSPEFVAALTCRSNSTLTLFVILSVIVASTAGPATAVLIIPRMIQFPAGETEYYINGTSDHLWPSYIGLENYLPDYTNGYNESIKCASSTGYTSAVCPSGGYLALMDHFSAGTLENRAGVQTPPLENTRIFAQSVRGGIFVQSSRGQVAPQTLSGQVRGEDITETFSYATHGAIANLPMRMNHDWYRAAQNAEFIYPQSLQSSRYRFYAVQQATIMAQVPAVRVLCGEGQKLWAGSQTVEFPLLPDHEVGISSNGTILSSHEVEIDQLSTSKPSNTVRVTWVDLRAALPVHDSQSVTYGLVHESPWQIDDSRIVSGCTIDARWAHASVWSRFPGPFQSTFLHTRAPTGNFRRTSFLPLAGTSWRRMLFDPEWLEAINFKLPELALGDNIDGVTALEALSTRAGIASNFTHQSAANTTSASIPYLEHLIASVLSDALSRVGSYRSYNTSGPIDEWPLLYYNTSTHTSDILAWSRALKPSDYDVSPHKYTKIRMRVSVTGYGYQSSTSSDYLSLAVLFIHLLLALVHTIYIVSTRRTSSCWDTFSELIALAQQSQPARSELSNTCTGINRLETFKHKVRVKVSEKLENHLELAFGEMEE